MPKKLLIVGWDGADWEIIDDLLKRGCLPNVADMLDHGVRGDLASTIPSHSWAAWSSFLTGMHPGGHGVYDFVEHDPFHPQKRVPVTSSSLKAETFLERLSASTSGHEVRVGNIPVTFPPIPVRGRMISGVAVPPNTGFVFPPEWEPELQRRAPFPLNGMEWVTAKSNQEALVDEARSLVKRRTQSFEVLLEGDWSVAACVYLATDRLQHAFGAYLLPTHPRHSDLSETPMANRLRDLYQDLDAALGRLRAHAGPDCAVVLMSDHGFRPLVYAANLNKLLSELGLAVRARTAGATTSARRSSLARAVRKSRLGQPLKKRLARPSILDWSRTTAYQSAMGGGVSLNLKGRTPHGTVEASDYEKTRDDVRDRLLSFADPNTGQHPVREVLYKEDLYHGPFADLAPDMFVQPSDLWSFAHTDALTEETDWPSGGHRHHGILLGVGDGIPKADLGEKSIVDVPATALAMCGVSAQDLDGEPIEEISGLAEERLEEVSPVSRLPAAGLSEQDEEHISQHLRDLGYIE